MKRFFKKIIYSVLLWEARVILWKYKPKIVSITGSVGKTSTKDAVFAVLSRHVYVRKSDKNYNTPVGLGLTVVGCPNGLNNFVIWFKNLVKGLGLILLPSKYPKWLVLEVGIGKPGDMVATAGWFKSDVVIMTAIGDTPVHVEFFDSRAHLVQEKADLINTLKPSGILILNKDDDTILAMQKHTKNKFVTYGFSTGADVLAGDLNINYKKSGEPKGLVFRIETDGNSLPVSMAGVFGKNHTYAAIAALAFGYAIKLNLVEAIDALKNYEPSPGRMKLIEGIKGSLIIDDTYNAAPMATKAALDTLAEINGSDIKRRKIAVLGDMLELGRHTQEEHEKVGKLAKKSADILVVVGPRANYIKEGALAARMAKGKVYEFSNSSEAGDFLQEFIESGDVVLIKGSQGIRMERTVEKVIAEHVDPRKTLVRQEPEWLAKK